MLHLLRLNDFGENWRICLREPNLTNPHSLDVGTHLLRKGEIVTCNRESRFTANIVPENLQAFAGSQMIVLAIIDTEAVMPEYVVWWLNRDDTGQRISEKATGAYNRTVSTSVVRKLEITIPPMPIQKRIVAMSDALLSEKHETMLLLQKRAELSAIVADRIINQSLTK